MNDIWNESIKKPWDKQVIWLELNKTNSWMNENKYARGMKMNKELKLNAGLKWIQEWN